MIFILIIIFIGIIYFEVPEMIKMEYWYELKVFYVFLAVAFMMSLFYILGLPIPNPVKCIEFLVRDVLHLNYK